MGSICLFCKSSGDAIYSRRISAMGRRRRVAYGNMAGNFPCLASPRPERKMIAKETSLLNCPHRCRRPVRKISGEKALALYLKLKPFLRYIPSWGCYTPARGTKEAGDHAAWPLHDWDGPGRFPVQVEWGPSISEPGPFITFNTFLRVYRLEAVEE